MSRPVVLVTFDSLRADHCHHLGYERDTTPTLDAMAAEGVTFTNAISSASRTNPSMAGAFTGQPLVARERVVNPALARGHLARYGTIAERFKSRGYATGAFSPNAYASRYFGFDRGFDHFEDFLFSTDEYQNVFEGALSDSRSYNIIRNIRNLIRRQEAFKTWDTYIDQIEAWVRDQEEPFFLWVFSLDTHYPYLTPRRYRQWANVFEMYYYNWRCYQLIDALDATPSAAELQHIIDIYDDSIRFGDALLAELRERLAEFDPIYVVHGDHGEAFSEHGVYGHFYPSLYDENIHVPLVVSGTDEEARVEEPISLLQLPTLLDRLAAGESITDLGDEYVIATDYDGRFDRNLTAVRTARWKYLTTVADGVQQDEAYDVRNDPTEQRNLLETTPETAVLGDIAERRNQHEREQVAIEAAVTNIVQQQQV